MRPNTMRAIDFWIGVPICFVLTLVHRLVSLLTPGDGRRGRPENILLIQLAEMGTMVVAAPAIRKLKKEKPDARLYFLAFEEIRPSVELIGLLESGRIFTIDSSSFRTLLGDTLRVLMSTRRHAIDTTINLETFVRFSAILSYLSGARRRVGFHRYNQEGVYTGDFLTHKVLYNPDIHAGQTFLDLVYALDASLSQIPLVKRPRNDADLVVDRLATDADARELIWAKLKERNSRINPSNKLVILNPNADDRFLMRQLPLDDYVGLARRLLEDPATYILVTGVAKERPNAEYIRSRLDSERVLDLTGATSLRELVDLYNVADVLITTDSGPAHFACLSGIHIVVFFGPELPNRYRPLSPTCDVVYAGFTCSPCVSPSNQRLTPCNDNLCLQNLDLDQVCRLVRDRLAVRST